MHESSKAQQIIEIVSELMTTDPTLAKKKLTKVTLEMGRPYIVSPDSLEFYFAELIKITPWPCATLSCIESKELGPELIIKSIEVDDLDTQEDLADGNHGTKKCSDQEQCDRER
ncbi:MAG: hydrogenase maturation nickel metallochaperone HypA [Oligoflexia bacterium]|nr:hydrogenase maturation nickel metallochaperone HypA [Oligoflexia bacterium]MBF0367449.1 hydrogenase maturation nickel metallochaperone HypA [Oligoflexia bacterium]